MTDEHPSIDDATIVAYLGGELSPHEVARVEHAVSEDAQFAEALDGMQEILKVSLQYPRYPSWDTKRMWHVFAERSGLASEAKVAYYSARQKERVFSRLPMGRREWYTIVGAMLVALAIVVGRNVDTSRFGTHKLPLVSTYTTGNGERANVTLPDGSLVALNVASRLDVPADYASGNHTVHLSGEALFTVVRHDGMPFTVLAGSMTARVLGTSFVVRHYTTDSNATVAVRDGKVAVGAMVIPAEQMVNVGRDGVPHLHPSDASLFTFATGVLTLNWVPLPAAIVELDRWYDADIRLGDPALATRYVKGEVGAGSLAGLAEILEMTYDVRVVRDGRVLTLFPRQ